MVQTKKPCRGVTAQPGVRHTAAQPRAETTKGKGVGARFCYPPHVSARQAPTKSIDSKTNLWCKQKSPEGALLLNPG